MSIPESQLLTWSNQGATVTAQATHESIRRALSLYTWPRGIEYDPYLQGSYRNFTNIYNSSDVDLVVELTSAFCSNLTLAERSQLGFGSADYGWNEFRVDVVRALISYYGAENIDLSGTKSIKVLPESGRLRADVVPAIKYRYYENLRLREEGITFWTVPGNDQIINYPKAHFRNGADKNSDHCTQGWYRPSTRMIKNSREKIVSNNSLLAGKYPSYFIECLLWNVPDRYYGINYQRTYQNVVSWLEEHLDSDPSDNFVCQNGMHYLFGYSSVQWNLTTAKEFVQKLVELWNGW